MKSAIVHENGFQLDTSAGYFRNCGVNVMAFDDIYPAGHQSGISIIMHGRRAATNGDLRFEQTPGQWQPTPKQENRVMNEAENTITTTLSYPNYEGHLKGFNPMIYPDYPFQYEVEVKGAGDAVLVTVNLKEPIPDKYVGKLCFNLELFPGSLFGKPWIMDNKQGIFPLQPNGPTLSMPTNYLHTDGFPVPDSKVDKKRLSGDNKGYNPIIADDIIAEPYACGRRFTVRPDDPYSRFTIETLEADLKLYDGRMNHNNGWFVLSSEIPAGKSQGAVRWIITPHVVSDWLYPPVIQTSQVGYHPAQPKKAVIELDKQDTSQKDAVLYRITEQGEEAFLTLSGEEWGSFLRYRYLVFPFTEVREEGLYKIRYGSAESSIFRIAEDIYDRGVWQPVLEYFLPVQMCHMRVNEKYRVWHGLCHNDDARMAPVNCLHFDGYEQGPSTLTKYQPGESVPGLNSGGWHDAGDYDLRIESQSGEAYILTLAFEEFHVDYDATTIDQQAKITEIHQPDGKNDILQQIEHGLLTVVGGYQSLGRLYRGIISSSLRQYVHLGDGSTMTNGIPGDEDDRWVFTEENPPRELTTVAHLAAASRAMRGFNDALGGQALSAASELYEITDGEGKARLPKIHAAVELFLTTGEQKYKDHLLAEREFITENIESAGWIICRALKELNAEAFTQAVRDALEPLKTHFDEQIAETPYGIPYRPYIWGAGWNIQHTGFHYYFLHKAFPDLFKPELIFNALNFVLGCHPGSNTASFASGVGAKSATTAYGCNRADWSYIPGGVVSGTALIRPDFPELLEFPFLWQQMEYVLGGGSSTYLFLVLAARQLLGRKPCN
ncbi:MAG: glycoside hydrolase family 9 protein [Lachnospiraceae bacterium]|nr:glycoside hydrolase family 9 protein [Lachnospiraceae bacterium]